MVTVRKLYGSAGLPKVKVSGRYGGSVLPKVYGTVRYGRYAPTEPKVYGVHFHLVFCGPVNKHPLFRSAFGSLPPDPGVVDPFMARAIPSACGGGGRRRPVLEDRLPWEGGGGSYERDSLRKDNL